MPNPDRRNANEIKIAESLLVIEGRLVDIDLRTGAMREAVDCFAENLLTIQGQFMRIDKNLDDLKIILEIISRHIVKEIDHAPKITSPAQGDVRSGSGEVDTWHPEKGG